MSEEKQKIIDESTKVFLGTGFYKTPMDEIARELKISKKTIYKHFDSKDTLVNAVVINFLEFNRNNIQKILAEDHNAVTKSFNLFQYLAKLLVSINYKWIEDIHNHYNHLWKEIDEFRTKMMLANLSKLIEQGKSEGYVIDYPTNILVMFFVSSLRGIINPDFILQSKMDPKTILKPTVNLLMNAILNDKGKKIFNELQPGVNL